MTQALDYSLARPDPAQIVADGYVGVLRYLAPAFDAPKIIYQPEYDALLAAGLKVVLNWEWYAARPKEGAAAGHADAASALAQADALGYKGAIYFSVDYDALQPDQAAIDAYFQACASVIGLQRLGAYAGYWPLKRLFDAGLIRYGWQTLAWSGGLRESRAHLYQTGAQVFGGCDVNDILKPNWTGGSMVPNGWTDDGTTLKAPDGTPVIHGFRDFVLANNWNANNWPMEAEHAQSPLELQNPSLGDGVQQVFRLGALEYTPAKGVFVAWIGGELLKVRADLAAALATPPAPPVPPPAPAPQPSAWDKIGAELTALIKAS